MSDKIENVDRELTTPEKLIRASAYGDGYRKGYEVGSAASRPGAPSCPHWGIDHSDGIEWVCSRPAPSSHGYPVYICPYTETHENNQYSCSLSKLHSSCNYLVKEKQCPIKARPAPLTQNDNGDCLIICQHCGKVTQVQCKDAALSPCIPPCNDCHYNHYPCATSTEPYPEICNDKEDWLKEHDAAIAAQAREDLLDEIIEWATPIRKNWPNNDCHRDPFDDIIKKAESLRTEAHK